MTVVFSGSSNMRKSELHTEVRMQFPSSVTGEPLVDAPCSSTCMFLLPVLDITHAKQLQSNYLCVFNNIVETIKVICEKT